MFVDELSTREALVRMVRRMTSNVALREDLLQEALIHLWLTETRRPGQTRSWYLQGCKYHLLHYLASGRSVDSAKRRAGQTQPGHELDECDSFPEESDSGNSVVNCVSARDIISLLSPQLQPHEREVLDCFADGLGPREIGRKLKMSHTMVIKHRRKIASLYTRLDATSLQSEGRTSGKANGYERPAVNGQAKSSANNGHANNGHANNGHANNGHANNGHANGSFAEPAKDHAPGQGHRPVVLESPLDPAALAAYRASQPGSLQRVEEVAVP